MKVFYDKKAMTILSLCAVVLLTLVFWLTTLFVQKTAFDRRCEQLSQYIEQTGEVITDYKQQLEFKQTWDYVIEYAEKNNLLTADELRWVKSSSGR